ncbi:MAG: hypothetical protein M3023_02205 [Pseudomonadota bacterium]|nr:hypothetical protein [Pseudomonadota bacterium]
MEFASVAKRADARLGSAMIAGLFGIVATASCAGVEAPPTSQAPPVATKAAASPSPSVPAVAAPRSSAPIDPANPSISPSTMVGQSAGKAETGSTKSGAIKGPPAQAVKKETAAPVMAKPTPAPLNLTTLEERLKATEAIGVLTKIALKNQVDDLLDQFRAFYQGKLKTTLAELRAPYDRLVLKVVSLLQDSDPSLASAIVASREAIWGILSDRAKFATVS